MNAMPAANQKLFKKDFSMVVIGQIISLFGNQILRFALPLYLLSQTDSPGLFGLISACSFLPMIVLCPVGGIIADRINKRNIMVILDFSTAALILLLTILLGKMDIVVLLLVTLIVLYGIQGTYQPAVQASIPALCEQAQIMQGNAVINLVSSLAGLIGPVIGGALFTAFGIMPILYISIGCFVFSAVMEIFIKIPFIKQPSTGNVFSIGFSDLKQSFGFIRHKQPSIWKISLIIASINMLLSALVIIGLPIIITKTLDFDADTGNKLYGYSQGAIAAGSLIGGLLAGALGKRLKAKNSPLLLIFSVLTLLPIGLALHFVSSPMAAYIILIVSCVIMMALASLFTIQMMAFLQILTPENLIGKVVSCAMCIGMCASPLGQALYGGLFEWLGDKPYLMFYMAAAVAGIICLASFKIFRGMDKLLEEAKTTRKSTETDSAENPTLQIRATAVPEA